MTAFNVVRLRVKPGRDKAFLDHMKMPGQQPTGARKLSVVKTGERAYCIIGEWDSMASIVAARSQMIANLDSFRDQLEDLGAGLGVTDPVSGEVVVEMTS
jgi:hypothetical protein